MTLSDLLIIGDSHQDLVFFQKHVIPKALYSKASIILQVGDFGYFPTVDCGKDFLNGLQSELEKNKLLLYWIDGNHEDFGTLFSKKYEKTEEGFWIITPNVFYIPRGLHWVWNGVRFLGCGGAYSLDKSSRRFYYDWWPEETVRPRDFEAAVDGETDVLLTHDVPNGIVIPFFDSNKHSSIAENVHNQMNVKEIMKLTKAKILFHGHLHFPYGPLLYEGTLVCGLGSNQSEDKKKAMFILKYADIKRLIK